MVEVGFWEIFVFVSDLALAALLMLIPGIGVVSSKNISGFFTVLTGMMVLQYTGALVLPSLFVNAVAVIVFLGVILTIFLLEFTRIAMAAPLPYKILMRLGWVLGFATTATVHFVA